MKISTKWALRNLTLSLIGVAGISLIGNAGLSRLVSTTQPADAAITLQENDKQQRGNNRTNSNNEHNNDRNSRADERNSDRNDRSGERNNDANEQVATQQLQSLARITPQQAQQAAIAANPGQVSRTQLENEDGNLVYAVVIGQNEVKVDAGNGNVLYTDSLNPERDATVRPRSSIQIPEPTGGDGDGETQDDR